MGIVKKTEMTFLGFSKEKGLGIKVKIGEKWELEPIPGIEGNLIDMFHVKKDKTEKEQFDTNSLTIVLTDDTIYKMTFGFMAGHSMAIINSLCSDKVTKLYGRKFKLTCKKKGEFYQFGVFLDDEYLNWKYKYEEIPATEEITMKNGKKVKDDSEKEKFLTKIFDELKLKFDAEKQNGVQHIELDNNSDDDSVPF